MVYLFLVNLLYKGKFLEIVIENYRKVFDEDFWMWEVFINFCDVGMLKIFDVFFF